MKRKKKMDWSVLRYLVYFSQIGITMITPPLVLAYGSLWLSRRFGLGSWVVVVGILLGIAVGMIGLKDLLVYTERQARKREKEEEDKLP